MTRNTIVDNVLIVIFAGYDTTASTFSTALKHLWQNSNVLELVKVLFITSYGWKSGVLTTGDLVNSSFHFYVY